MTKRNHMIIIDGKAFEPKTKTEERLLLAIAAESDPTVKGPLYQRLSAERNRQARVIRDRHNRKNASRFAWEDYALGLV